MLILGLVHEVVFDVVRLFGEAVLCRIVSSHVFVAHAAGCVSLQVQSCALPAKLLESLGPGGDEASPRRVLVSSLSSCRLRSLLRLGYKDVWNIVLMQARFMHNVKTRVQELVAVLVWCDVLVGRSGDGGGELWLEVRRMAQIACSINPLVRGDAVQVACAQVLIQCCTYLLGFPHRRLHAPLGHGHHRCVALALLRLVQHLLAAKSRLDSGVSRSYRVLSESGGRLAVITALEWHLVYGFLLERRPNILARIASADLPR